MTSINKQYKALMFTSVAMVTGFRRVMPSKRRGFESHMLVNPDVNPEH